ncbi:MAG: Minf_1886 family protein [Kiritimatiellia bacterium]|jgi:uncharacterized repeat protein (TIGR04138 family)
MNEQSFEETVARICDTDDRYDMEAYFFIREALDHAARKFNREPPNRHVTGAELSEGVREYALNEFGPLAYLVLTEWGLHTTGDFGEIVYNLIAEGVFGKSETDRREDFNDVYNFHDAFVEPFEPTLNSPDDDGQRKPRREKS